MELLQVGHNYIFRLPIAISMLTTIRKQLGTVSDQSPELTNLMATNLIHCKRIDRQPLTYLSAVSHQLLPGLQPIQSEPYLSATDYGIYLLEQLAAVSHTEPTAQWQGTVNDQGYLYLQPTERAITDWLNHLLSIKNVKINSDTFPLPAASSITLQYLYTRCMQLLDLAHPSPLTGQGITTADLTARTTTTVELELIGAIADIWDQIATHHPKHYRQILALSRQLVEQFLDFEKTCCFGNKKNQSHKNLDYGLLAIVQITVKTILQTYWNLEPLGYW